MEAKEIKNMGKKLRAFLKEFDDCFYRSQPRKHLGSYVRGQVSSLQRKSAEPIALLVKTPPRTLQRFLSYVHWDEQRLRDRIQWIVTRDHAHPEAIGIVDDTGHPKKGSHTACVQRQWCGKTGKKDNCVVSVHIGYAVGDFQCLLDSDLYLPESWADDPERRKQAGIPEDVIYRKKTDMALGQISRALNNGVRVFAWTFDEWYGKDGAFLDGLQGLGQNYVAEVPANFTGWVHEPAILLCPRTEKRHKRGRRRHFPRLSAKALPPCEVRNLLVFSRKFQKQRWKKFYIKEGEKGPLVWEVKCSKFYRKQGEDSLPGSAHCLIVARNVLDPEEIKYFVSNMLPGSNDVTLEKLLRTAFSRWPIERCFELAKNEIGMDHFEVRSWRGIHRHLYISQLSQLFCCHVHQELREKNSGQFVPDSRTDSLCGIRVGSRSELSAISSDAGLSSGIRGNPVPSEMQSASQGTSCTPKAAEIASFGYPCREVTLLYSG
ncbi:MAG TPA: IS701 family transposase [Candidatus Bathyarchaeia archaeon]|nr:IS701 family transposase [Candidatus Bathyarchaeia archaeon]